VSGVEKSEIVVGKELVVLGKFDRDRCMIRVTTADHGKIEVGGTKQ
jgi:hypothetical protein